MEELKVLDYSNVFIASYFTDNRECSHANAEHTLIYLVSGELEITDNGKKTILRPGGCIYASRPQDAASEESEGGCAISFSSVEIQP